MIVDLGYNQPPAIKKDPFWEGPIEPLYTQQSMIFERHMNTITGSLAHIRLSYRSFSLSKKNEISLNISQKFYSFYILYRLQKSLENFYEITSII